MRHLPLDQVIKHDTLTKSGLIKHDTCENPTFGKGLKNP